MSRSIEEAATSFAERYEEVRFSRKRDMDRVYPHPTDFVARLEQWIASWEAGLKELQSLAGNLNAEDIRQSKPTHELVQLADMAVQLLSVLEDASLSVGPPALAHIHKELVSKLNSLLFNVALMLDYYVPSKQPTYNLDAIIAIFPLDIQGSAHAIYRVKNQVQRAKNEASHPVFQNPLPRLWKQLPNRILDARVQRRMLALALLLVLLVPRLLPTDILPIIQIVAKLLIWLITILWFPVFALAGIGGTSLVSLILFGLMWVFVLSPLAYGFWKGIIVAILLVGVPLSQLMRSDFKNSKNVPPLSKRFHLVAGLGLFLVGTVVTHETLWWRSLLIWLAFTAVTGASFRYFRSTFDMVESLYSKQRVGSIRHRLILVALVASIGVLFPGILPPLSPAFLTSVYRDAATFAFGMIAILLAVQTIIPGITTWLQGADIAAAIREKKILLTVSSGLGGFMLVFFVVFIVALLGSSFSALAEPGKPLVHLGLDTALTPTSSIVDVFNPFSRFSYSSELTITTMHTSLFIFFICLIAYSLALLYYLFIATNTTLLPIRDALLSSPIVIEKWDLPSIGVEEDKHNAISKARDNIDKALHNHKELHGEVIRRILLTTCPAGSGIYALIDMEIDFPELPSLLKGSMAVFGAVLSETHVERVKLQIERTDRGLALPRRLLLLEIGRNEYDFLTKDVPGMNLEYKMEQLGASIARYHLPEAQVA